MKHLIQKALEGDLDAFALIVKKWEKPVYNLTLRMLKNPQDAQDTTQEIFIKVYTQLGDYRADAPFSYWIYRIATHTCLDQVRHRKREQKRKSSQFLEEYQRIHLHSAQKNDPAERLQQKELQTVVLHAIDQLSEKYRIVLLLHVNQELSYQEIGYVLDLSIKTVGTRLYRAKKLLKKKLYPFWKGGAMDELQHPLLSDTETP